MITATVDMSGFNAGIAGLITRCKLNSRVVVAKETGELIKELVRLTPPKEPKRTRASIKGNIHGMFNILRQDQGSFDKLDAKEGRTGIKWYAASSNYLFGGARDSDMRKASQATLIGIKYKTKHVQGANRLVLPFKNRKTSQRVAILTRVVTTKEQVNELVKRFQNRVGRLKAGWLHAVKVGSVQISGAHMPPGWVTKHMPGLRGNSINGLNVPNNPNFTLINNSKGASKIQFFVELAVKSRAASMVSNAGRMFSGKKKLSTYALAGAAYNAAK